MKYTIIELSTLVEEWLTTGKINPAALAVDFTFSSPYWQDADKNEFLKRFLDPSEYISKSLSNITSFDPLICCISQDQTYFALYLRYHTRNHCSVDEVVFCTVKDGMLYSMRTIYDLEQTKIAHNLC